jgi:hypothetical protein
VLKRVEKLHASLCLSGDAPMHYSQLRNSWRFAIPSKLTSSEFNLGQYRQQLLMAQNLAVDHEPKRSDSGRALWEHGAREV